MIMRANHVHSHFAGEGARATPASRRQCSRTRSRATSGRTRPSACTEGDKDSRIRLLQVWKPPTITVFGQRRCFGRHRVGRAPSPATSPMAELLHLGFQVSDEGTCSTNLFPKMGSPAELAISRARGCP